MINTSATYYLMIYSRCVSVLHKLSMGFVGIAAMFLELDLNSTGINLNPTLFQRRYQVTLDLWPKRLEHS